MSEEQNKSKKNIARIIVLIIAILVLICSSAYICFYFYNNYMAGKEQEKFTSTTQNTTAEFPSEVLAENPIDFVSLSQQNDEIYAWIKIDDTEVDYPVAQSKTDDEFYLKHSAIDKSWLESGAIYTEGTNSLDFSDPITVIYGHNGYKNTMFTTLHKFEKSDFFDSHPYFYIYQPQRKLTYQVISAFKYDNRHIMNSFNFYAGTDLADFQQMILNPNSPVRNVRQNLDTAVNENSKIVILSTCITGQKDNRYLICGVLVKDEKTN